MIARTLTIAALALVVSRAPAQEQPAARPRNTADSETTAPAGLRAVEFEEDVTARTLRVVAITPGGTDAGPLRTGDLILGVKNRKFKTAPRAEFDEAVDAARAEAHDHNLRMLHSRDGVERTIDFLVEPPPPDLTQGGKRDDDNEWNLGPTGAKGWIFCRGFDTGAARQILITAIEPGSPAQRVLEIGDVILGVNGHPFESDARVAFGRAIGEAEQAAAAGCLTVTRWRAGEVKPATIQLPMLGSYSDSAPYECDKSLRIVEAGCRAIAARGLKVRSHDIRRDDWQPPIPTTINALALLASEDPQYLDMVREYARTIAPADLTLELQPGLYTWSWGYANLFACEYYLATKDESVLPAIRAYSGAIARGQSLVGTWGHGFRLATAQGSLNGYGAVNQTGLICWMSLALAQRCGVDDPEVKHAVELSRTFFRFYTGKGSVPYGDHPPYWLHDDNGKSSSAAITFAMLGDREDAEFFSRMAVAAYGEKELGHTGNYFGYLWGALAANLSGPRAVAAFMEEQRWYYDLARRWDGSWYTNKRDNYDWDMTGLFVLHHALPMRSLVITGKNIDGCAPLEGAPLARVIASGRDFPLGRTDDACVFMSTEELLRDLADWSPTRRHRAAEALSQLSDGAIMPALLGMLGAEGADGKLGACLALQYMENRAAPATDALIALLDHPSAWVRIRAAFALASIGKPAMKAVPRLLELCNANNPADPRGIEAKYISLALFRADFIDQVPKRRGLLADSMQGVDKDLAYTAIRRMLTCDDGLGTMSVQSIFRSMSDEELAPLLPEILHATRTTPASGEMFAHEIRERAMRYLAERKIDAGLGAIMEYISTQDGWGNRTRQVLPLLVNYSTRAGEFLPELKALRDRWAANDRDTDKPARASIADETIAKIEAATK